MENIIMFSDWLWSGPILIIIIVGGIYISLKLKFMQFFKLPTIIKSICKDAKTGEKSGAKGNITPLETALTAIGSTLGAGNIMGMGIAISMGGLGAIFWMLVMGLFAMCIKYSEIILGIKYRELNIYGEYVGGPAYYLKNSMVPIFGGMFALIHALQVLPSVGTQALSVVKTASTINIPVVVTATVMFLVIFITVIGGVKRIASVMDKMVPFMAIAYFVLAWIVILYNYRNLPIVFTDMFRGAFSAPAAFGGIAGGTVAMTLRSGFARATYSSEAGLGTTSIAYAAATTDFPARQALWGIVEVFVSTFIMCLTSALLIATTGVYKGISLAESPSMPALAMQQFYGKTFGGIAMTFIIILFVLSTIIVEVLMGQREIEYLFGSKVGNSSRYVYILFILIGSFIALGDIVSLLDLTNAILVFLNMFALITMIKIITGETSIFFKTLDKELKNK